MGELAGASPTERARMLAGTGSRGDSIALAKGLLIAVSRLSGDGLALSVTFGDSSPKGGALGMSGNSALDAESSIWRKK